MIDQDGVFFSRERREIVEGQYHLQVDTIDTTGENDMTFKRNNVDEVDGNNKLMNFASNGAVSANKLFGNYFSNRSYSVDTVFEGSNTAGNARVQYMRYDVTNEVIQLAKPLTMTYNTKLKWGMNSFVETTSETVLVTRFDAPNSSRARDQKI